MVASTRLFGRIAGLELPGASVKAGPKSKNVCQPMKRRRARAPPRRSGGSAWFCGRSPLGSKTISKNAVPSLSPARFAR